MREIEKCRKFEPKEDKTDFFFQLSALDCDRLLSSKYFSSNLTQLSFFLCDDLTDDLLAALTRNNTKLERIALVECPKVSDQVRKGRLLQGEVQNIGCIGKMAENWTISGNPQRHP